MDTEELITKFLALTFMYIREEKSIDFYAGKMNLNALELNTLLHNINRKEFPEWIKWLDVNI